MAVITNTPKTAGAMAPTTISLGSSGDTLVYLPNSGQELVLFNTDTISRTVTIDGAGGTTVVIPNTGGTTYSVALGYTITIAAGKVAVVNLDTISAFVQGSPVTIVADLAAKVTAAIIY